MIENYIARNSNIGYQISEKSDSTQNAIKNNFFLLKHDEMFKEFKFDLDLNFNSNPELPETATVSFSA